jgi:hypothetical protein
VPPKAHSHLAASLSFGHPDAGRNSPFLARFTYYDG